jgi:hypothetical protein
MYVRLMKYHHRPSDTVSSCSESSYTLGPHGIVSVLPGDKFSWFLNYGDNGGGMDTDVITLS